MCAPHIAHTDAPAVPPSGPKKNNKSARQSDWQGDHFLVASLRTDGPTRQGFPYPHSHSHPFLICFAESVATLLSWQRRTKTVQKSAGCSPFSTPLTLPAYFSSWQLAIVSAFLSCESELCAIPSPHPPPPSLRYFPFCIRLLRLFLPFRPPPFLPPPSFFRVCRFPPFFILLFFSSFSRSGQQNFFLRICRRASTKFECPAVMNTDVIFTPVVSHPPTHTHTHTPILLFHSTQSRHACFTVVCACSTLSCHMLCSSPA